jgi:hypothetical protein
MKFWVYVEEAQVALLHAPEVPGFHLKRPGVPRNAGEAHPGGPGIAVVEGDAATLEYLEKNGFEFLPEPGEDAVRIKPEVAARLPGPVQPNEKVADVIKRVTGIDYRKF